MKAGEFFRMKQAAELLSVLPNTIRAWGASGSFLVCHAYFLGANDPYKSLKTTLKAEINEEE